MTASPPTAAHGRPEPCSRTSCPRCVCDGFQKRNFPRFAAAEDSFFVWRAKGLRRGAISIHNSIREREQPRGCRRRAGALARWVLNALFAAWWAAEDQKWEPQKEKEGIGALVKLELKTLTKSLKTSPSEAIVGFAPGVISGGLLGPLRGRTLVKDTLCWSTYQQDMAQ